MQNVDAAGLSIGDDHPPRVMGVLNVSSESPHDPSVFEDPGEAAAYVDGELVGEGADIVDVGLASTEPSVDVLGPEAELDRLDTAVETLHSAGGDAVWSIETRYSEVAEAALDAGFDMVNDVCGFADPEMPAVCREYDAAVVKMASPDLERPGAVEEIPWAERRSATWAERADYVDKVYAALEEGGLTDRTIVDPAFGVWSGGKTTDDDRALFGRLREFRGLDRPILVSFDTEAFLAEVAGRSTGAALPATLAATAMAVERGADVVRTHDVAETADAARVGDAFARERVRATAGGVAVEELDVTTAREAERHLHRLGLAGSGVDPGAAVAGTYEISGLDARERERLSAAADRTGCTVWTGADGRLLLFGSIAAAGELAATPELPDGVSTALGHHLGR